MKEKGKETVEIKEIDWEKCRILEKYVILFLSGGIL